MDSPQAIETHKMPFYGTHLPESLATENDSQEFPEVLEFRKLSNRFSERPILIEITPEDIVKRVIPEHPLNGAVPFFEYMLENIDYLTSANLGVRFCPDCHPKENLHIKTNGYPKKSKFIRIGGLNQSEFPQYYKDVGHYKNKIGRASCRERV
jgi:hypothetical protein